MGKAIGRIAACLALGVAAAGCARHGSLAEAAFEEGGVAFDFSAISAKNDKSVRELSSDFAPPIAEWVKDPGVWFHRLSCQWNDPKLRALAKVARVTLEDGALHYEKPYEASLAALGGDENLARIADGHVSARIPLADTNGATYRISFEYQARARIGSTLYCLPFHQANGKDTGGLGYLAAPLRWGEWTRFARAVNVPRGVDALRCVMRLDGIGEFKFRNWRIVRVAEAPAFELALWPHGYLDGTFAVSSNQAAVLCFDWRKRGTENYVRERTGFVFDLPKGFEVVSSNFMDTNTLVKTALEDGGARLSFKASAPGWHPPQRHWTDWLAYSFVIRPTEPMPKGTAVLKTYYDGKRLGNAVCVELFTIPSIASRQPKRYWTGFDIMGSYFSANTDEGCRAIAELLGAAGAGWVIGGGGKTMELWRRHGVKRFTPEIYYIANGFRVGDGEGRPAEDRYVTIDGQPDPDGGRATCPLAVAEERPYFMTNTLPKIAKAVKGTDGVWANWEPWQFAGRGCACAHCREGFGRWAKISKDELRAGWPKELGLGGKWHDLGRKYRSYTHGLLVKTLGQHIPALTGGTESAGFIPGICWGEMTSAWRPRNLAPEVQAIDYAGSLRWICPWGPYYCWDTEEAYVPNDKGVMGTFAAAKDVKAQVAKDYGAKAPKLMAFPQGQQGQRWVTQPEWLAMSMDAFFFAGWDSTLVYLFPRGYDNRYWRAFAEATTRATDFEDDVKDGTPADAVTTVTPVAEYPANLKCVSLYLPEGDYPVLPSAAFERGPRRIVAVMNFWEKGEAFFRLRAKMLPAGDWCVLDERGVAFAPSADRVAWAADELAAGVLLRVPACRTHVFTLVPAKTAKPVAVHSAAAVKAAYEAHRPALAAAAARAFLTLENER